MTAIVDAVGPNDIEGYVNFGPGWIIVEESARKESRLLISILSPRRTERDIERYLQQVAVDRYGSIHERLVYKRSHKRSPYQILSEPFGGLIHCGHDPFLVCYYATAILLRGTSLRFRYRIAVDRTHPTRPVFEDREQVLDIRE